MEKQDKSSSGKVGVNEHERPSSTTPKHQLVCIKFDLFSCTYILLMNKQTYDEMVSYFYLCICSFKILVELNIYVSVVVFFLRKTHFGVVLSNVMFKNNKEYTGKATITKQISSEIAIFKR